jgi:hypothetical protein
MKTTISTQTRTSKPAEPRSGPRNEKRSTKTQQYGQQPRAAARSPSTYAPDSADWLRETDPWPKPVDGAELLHQLTCTLQRFVVMPKWAPETVALWILHTYAFELRQVSTYLGVDSPEKRCGKTTLLTVLTELVNRPVVASNISPPALFRAIEEVRPTLLIDEADTLLSGNDEIRGILNAGYSRKTAFVLRVSHFTAPTRRAEAERRRKSLQPFEVQGSSSSPLSRSPVVNPVQVQYIGNTNGSEHR